MAARKPKAVTIRHATDKNCVRVTLIMSQPMQTAPNHPVRICNACHIHHPFKAIHFWLGPNGEATVAAGIWKTLQEKVGNGDGQVTADGFSLVSEVKKPPALRIGRGGDRTVVDNENRRQVIYNADPGTNKGAK